MKNKQKKLFESIRANYISLIISVYHYTRRKLLQDKCKSENNSSVTQTLTSDIDSVFEKVSQWSS